MESQEERFERLAKELDQVFVFLPDSNVKFTANDLVVLIAEHGGIEDGGIISIDFLTDEARTLFVPLFEALEKGGLIRRAFSPGIPSRNIPIQ